MSTVADDKAFALTDMEARFLCGLERGPVKPDSFLEAQIFFAMHLRGLADYEPLVGLADYVPLVSYTLSEHGRECLKRRREAK